MRSISTERSERRNLGDSRTTLLNQFKRSREIRRSVTLITHYALKIAASSHYKGVQ